MEVPLGRATIVGQLKLVHHGGAAPVYQCTTWYYPTSHPVVVPSGWVRCGVQWRICVRSLYSRDFIHAFLRLLLGVHCTVADGYRPGADSAFSVH